MLSRRILRFILTLAIVSAVIFTVLNGRHSYKSSVESLSLDQCTGTTVRDRICRLANFCFDFESNEFLHVRDSELLPNITDSPNSSYKRFADMSSVDDHNTYYWSWRTVPSLNNSIIVDAFRDPVSGLKQVLIVDHPVHLTKRFYPVNIMHLFHDDVLGMADVLLGSNPSIKEYWFVDEYSRGGPYESVYSWLGRPWKQLKDYKAPSRMICYTDATISNSKRFVWYQYGFKQAQSVVEHSINGVELAQVFNYLREKAGAKISPSFYRDRKMVFDMVKAGQRSDKNTDIVVSVFTRRKTRLLLNEDELVAKLEGKFGLSVVRVGLEDKTVEQIVQIMSKTAVAIGLHGSLLVMAGFMPPGGILIEGFPYAVPPNDYKPYAELCRILGHQYATWSSPYPDKPFTRGHPERGKYEGGLMELSDAERDAIFSQRWIKPHKCCYDAAWLYRVFQDTAMDVDIIITKILALVKSK